MASDFFLAERIFRLTEESYRTRRSMLTVTSLMYLYHVAEINETITIFGTSVEISKDMLGILLALISLYFFCAFTINVAQDLKEFRRDELVIAAKQLKEAAERFVNSYEHNVKEDLQQRSEELIQNIDDFVDEHTRSDRIIGSVQYTDFDFDTLLDGSDKINDVIRLVRERHNRCKEYYKSAVEDQMIQLGKQIAGYKNSLQQQICELKDQILRLENKQRKLFIPPNSMHTIIDIWLPMIYCLLAIAWYCGVVGIATFGMVG